MLPFQSKMCSALCHKVTQCFPNVYCAISLFYTLLTRSSEGYFYNTGSGSGSGSCLLYLFRNAEGSQNAWDIENVKMNKMLSVASSCLCPFVFLHFMEE